MATYVLAIGSNLGNREQILEKARDLIHRKAGRLEKVSSIFETAPWGNENQPAFLNQILSGQTSYAPKEFLRILLQIEQRLGRVREEKWTPRLIDIDILYYEQLIVHEDDLHIPHPHLQDRKFVLEPLAEILPDYIHPVSGKTSLQLLAEVQDKLPVAKYKPLGKLSLTK